jgi:threonine-phosphate decarboxylase
MAYTYDHGGDIYSAKEAITDFSININPLGMPDSIKKAARSAIEACESYPDHSCRKLREAIAARFDVSEENIICGNGASDLIYRLFAAVKPSLTLLIAPSFSEYQRGAEASGGSIKWHKLSREEGFNINDGFLEAITPDVKLVFLCNPNNPTGRAIKRGLLIKIAEKCEKQGAVFALDECFLELSEGHKDSLKECINGNRHLFILRAFTKDYAMPGLRLGYGFCGDPELLDKMRLLGQPWSVSAPAQAAGIEACKDISFLEKSRELIRAERKFLLEELTELELEVVESDTNFILFRLPGIADLKERLLSRNIFIRSLQNSG